MNQDADNQELSYLGLANEEELKIRFLVPLLERLGLYRDDLHFEESFSFKAGRQTLSENVKSALVQKRPRLDIRASRGGQNLFIIEAKAPGHTLTDSDRLQAISYARLIHPMAPYAIVTNGRQTRLYDTITREEIFPPEVKIDGAFTIQLPGSDDFDALDCFLRLNTENLLRFAKAQTTEALRPLRGSTSDLTKKYIPDLHHPRPSVGRALSHFVQSSDSTLALVSESGMGKTSCMCHRALELLEAGRPVLFLRGSEVGGRLLERIAEEFAWTFAETLSPPALVQRLSRLAGDALLLFVDAIDEWPAKTAAEQLGALASHLADTRLKLVVSCKSAAWSSFLVRRDTPTDFSTQVATHENENAPGLTLHPFRDEGFFEVLRKYKQVFGFHGVWDKNLLEETKRSPFFMRIAFEVAKEHSMHELRETSLEIFDRYYRSCVNKTAKPDLANRVLSKTAEALFQKNTDRIRLTQLRSALELRVTEDLPQDLFLAGVLEYASVDGARAVRFAFESLRNYVIAFHALNWNELTVEAFRKEVRHLDQGGVKEEALIAYYKLAGDQHKRVLDSDIYEFGTRLIDAYQDIIRVHFSEFAASFPPGDIDNAGLVLEANLRTDEAYQYGLRLLRPGDTRILILPTTSPNWLSDSLLRFGAGGLAYQLGHGSLRRDLVEELLQVNFTRLIPEVVRDGALNEETTPDLARELLAAAVLSKPDLLNEPNRGPGKESLPLRPSRIRYWLLFQYHWRQLADDLVQAKLNSGAIPRRRKGNFVTYSRPLLSEEERRELTEKCNLLIKQGAEMGRPRTLPSDEIAKRLIEAIECLDNDDLLEGPLFPEAYDIRRSFQHGSLDKSSLLEAHRRFLESFLQNYKGLLETNFPTLKGYFPLYEKLPVYLRFAFPEQAQNPPYFYMEILEPTTGSLENSVVESLTSRTFLKPGDSITINGRSFKISQFMESVQIPLRGGRKHYPDFRLRGWHTALRDYTYSWIESELREVGPHFGKLYGLKNFSFRL